MEDRLIELGLRWQDVATAGGVSLRALVRARTGEQELTPRTLAAIDKGLRWERGTAARILTGEEPLSAPLRPEPQRLERRGAPFPQQLIETINPEATLYFGQLRALVEKAAREHGADLTDPSAALTANQVFPPDLAGVPGFGPDTQARWDFLMTAGWSLWQAAATLAFHRAVDTMSPEVRAHLIGGRPGGCSAAGLPRATP
jgi:hypothetical protein